MPETYPAVQTNLSFERLAQLIRDEGENKTYMGAIRRLGARLNQDSSGWYTPNADPFAASHPLGPPDLPLGLRGPGWSVLFYIWRNDGNAVLEMQRTVGVDSGPAKELVRRIQRRLSE